MFIFEFQSWFFAHWWMRWVHDSGDRQSLRTRKQGLNKMMCTRCIISTWTIVHWRWARGPRTHSWHGCCKETKAGERQWGIDVRRKIMLPNSMYYYLLVWLIWCLSHCSITVKNYMTKAALRTGNHLIEGLLTVSEGGFMTIVVRSMAAGRLSGAGAVAESSHYL